MLIFALTLGTVHLVAAEVDLSDLLQVAGDIEENSQISEMEDLRSHIDTDDFKRQVTSVVCLFLTCGPCSLPGGDIT